MKKSYIISTVFLALYTRRYSTHQHHHDDWTPAEGHSAVANAARQVELTPYGGQFLAPVPSTGARNDRARVRRQLNFSGSDGSSSPDDEGSFSPDEEDTQDIPTWDINDRRWDSPYSPDRTLCIHNHAAEPAAWNKQNCHFPHPHVTYDYFEGKTLENFLFPPPPVPVTPAPPATGRPASTCSRCSNKHLPRTPSQHLPRRHNRNLLHLPRTTYWTHITHYHPTTSESPNQGNRHRHVNRR